LYAFSTENWNRSKDEIAYLIMLFRKMITSKLDEMHEKGIRVNIIGRLGDWPKNVQQAARTAIDLTRNNDKMTVNIAMSYGGHAEIVDATKRIIADGLKPGEITEEKFAEYIYEAGQPNPDVIVRTSGENRLSGFMLWQSAYSELYFTEVFWPDFNEAEVDKVIEEYNRRERRFGK
jgi:undecaprenyl diphosphate synthase